MSDNLEFAIFVSAVLMLLLGLFGGAMYTDHKNNILKKEFMEICIEKHSPADCAASLSATK